LQGIAVRSWNLIGVGVVAYHSAIGIPGPFSVSEDSMKKIKSYNTAALNKQKEERSEKYDIESFTFPVSPQFAEELHKKMVSLIGNFKGKGVPRRIIGGHSVVFRNVVEDEVWSLRIKNPKVHPLKELCIQILADAKTNQLDESKYMAVLNTLEE